MSNPFARAITAPVIAAAPEAKPIPKLAQDLRTLQAQAPESTPASEDDPRYLPEPEPKPQPRLAGMFARKTPEPAPTPTPAPIREITLDTLDSIELPDIEEREVKRSHFDDETPATLPMRNLPEDIDSGQLNFVEMIDSVYGMLHEPELLSSVIRSIMIELQENKQYITLIANEDVQTWIRAMRDGMGLARVKKTEKKAKTSARGSKSTLSDDELAGAFSDLGINMGDFD